MLLRHVRLLVHGVEEGVDELAHAVFAEVVDGRAEVRAVPVARPVPPAPVAVIHVRADVAHQVGDAEDLAERALEIRPAAGPGNAGLPQPVPFIQ